MKRVEVNYDLCTGCRLCEIACSIKKEGAVFPQASRVRVYQFHQGLVEIPVLFAVCSDCPSQAACPPKVKAISRNSDTMALEINEEKCLGIKCSLCAKACRFHSAITFHPQSQKALVCDVCNGAPECVQVCPTSALTYQGGSIYDGSHIARTVESVAEAVAAKYSR